MQNNASDYCVIYESSHFNNKRNKKNEYTLLFVHFQNLNVFMTVYYDVP